MPSQWTSRLGVCRAEIEALLSVIQRVRSCCVPLGLAQTIPRSKSRLASQQWACILTKYHENQLRSWLNLQSSPSLHHPKNEAAALSHRSRPPWCPRWSCERLRNGTKYPSEGLTMRNLLWNFRTTMTTNIMTMTLPLTLFLIVSWRRCREPASRSFLAETRCCCKITLRWTHTWKTYAWSISELREVSVAR